MNWWDWIDWGLRILWYGGGLVIAWYARKTYKEWKRRESHARLVDLLEDLVLECSEMRLQYEVLLRVASDDLTNYTRRHMDWLYEELGPEGQRRWQVGEFGLTNKFLQAKKLLDQAREQVREIRERLETLPDYPDDLPIHLWERATDNVDHRLLKASKKIPALCRAEFDKAMASDNHRQFHTSFMNSFWDTMGLADSIDEANPDLYAYMARSKALSVSTEPDFSQGASADEVTNRVLGAIFLRKLKEMLREYRR